MDARVLAAQHSIVELVLKRLLARANMQRVQGRTMMLFGSPNDAVDSVGYRSVSIREA